MYLIALFTSSPRGLLQRHTRPKRFCPIFFSSRTTYGLASVTLARVQSQGCLRCPPTQSDTPWIFTWSSFRPKKRDRFRPPSHLPPDRPVLYIPCLRLPTANGSGKKNAPPSTSPGLFKYPASHPSPRFPPIYKLPPLPTPPAGTGRCRRFRMYITRIDDRLSDRYEKMTPFPFFFWRAHQLMRYIVGTFRRPVHVPKLARAGDSASHRPQ